MFKYFMLIVLIVVSVCEAHSHENSGRVGQIGIGSVSGNRVRITSEEHFTAGDGGTGLTHHYHYMYTWTGTYNALIYIHDFGPLDPLENPVLKRRREMMRDENNNPPPPQNNNPVVGGSGPSSAIIEESSTTDGTPTTQPVGPVGTSVPQQRYPTVLQIQPLRVTEYMVRDWSGIGFSNLPQWIELYNPNTEAVNLKGWTFQYATRQFANSPIKIHTLTLADIEDGFSIAGGDVAILATQAKLPARRFSGIQESQVYALNIENVLKRGWVLKDAGGREIHRIGREAFSALSDPVAPPHQVGARRVSHHAYPSEASPEPHYYGYRNDVGSPGFYEQPAPAAPSAVRKPKKTIMWGQLKRVK